MKKYNKSEVFTKAWEIKKLCPEFTFSECLTDAWLFYKRQNQKRKPVTQSDLNRIFNSLKPICIKATKEHFRLLNSRKYKAVMKSTNNESRDMLMEGIVFANDIYHQRRLDSTKFTFKSKQKEKFRNRIIRPETCVKINIEEYVNSENK